MKPVRRDPPWSGPPCRGAPTSPRSARWTTGRRGRSGGEAPATLVDEPCTEAPGVSCEVASAPHRVLAPVVFHRWGLRASRPGPTVASGRRSCWRSRPPAATTGRRSSTGVRGSGYARPIRCDRQLPFRDGGGPSTAANHRFWSPDQPLGRRRECLPGLKGDDSKTERARRPEPGGGMPSPMLPHAEYEPRRQCRIRRPATPRQQPGAPHLWTSRRSRSAVGQTALT